MTKVETAKDLAVVIKQSGLDTDKVDALMNQFDEFFVIAADWEEKTKAIVVTDASQTMEIAAAKAGRLFLRGKRLAVESCRKQLKEQALREGQCIDRVARTLKDLIVPLEQHLEKQEKFVELKLAEEMQAKREEEERIAEEERLAAEEAERERLAKIEADNAELRKQLAQRQAVEKAARTRLLKERAAVEKEKADLAAAEEEKREAERYAARREAAAKKVKMDAALEAQRRVLRAERDEKARLERELAAMITCPECGHKFTKEE